MAATPEASISDQNRLLRPESLSESTCRRSSRPFSCSAIRKRSVNGLALRAPAPRSCTAGPMRTSSPSFS